MKNLIVGQSGGPTAVINGSLYGVVKEAVAHKDEIGKVYGMVNGIEGFLKETLFDLGEFAKTEEFELLKTTPSSFLSSCRFKLPDSLEDEVYARIFSLFEKYEIGYFFYIGGNDSMDTVSKLSRYAVNNNIEGITFIGVPKTVDNDLVITDHTPGFGSAAKFVATEVREISVDASVYDNKKTLTIVEVMGRHAGWLTAASALARNEHLNNPVLIYLPEKNFSIDKFVADVNKAFEKQNTVVACVSEGIHDENGKLICEYGGEVEADSFGHKKLAGTAKVLENLVADKFSVKTRSVELSVMQRASSILLSNTDLSEAICAGETGVKKALEGVTGMMIGFVRSDDPEYHIDFVPMDVNKICNEEKPVPAEWITEDENDVTDDVLKYMLPIIQGDVNVPKENGLPRFAFRK